MLQVAHLPMMDQSYELGLGCVLPHAVLSSASLTFTDYSQVDRLGVWYKSINF